MVARLKHQDKKYERPKISGQQTFSAESKLAIFSRFPFFHLENLNKVIQGLPRKFIFSSLLSLSFIFVFIFSTFIFISSSVLFVPPRNVRCLIQL